VQHDVVMSRFRDRLQWNGFKMLPCRSAGFFDVGNANRLFRHRGRAKLADLRLWIARLRRANHNRAVRTDRGNSLECELPTAVRAQHRCHARTSSGNQTDWVSDTSIVTALRAELSGSPGRRVSPDRSSRSRFAVTME